MKKSLAGAVVVILLLSLPAFAVNARPDTDRFTHGAERVLLAPFQIPVQTYRWTRYGPPITGTLSGVLVGAVRTVTDLLGGLFDMTAAAVPYAKYAFFAF